ncbi:hypothetical protein [Metabacillus arenae]|uniref:Uncharacterized protein n=1 Tax=Metabacillus arenae TaxID=2771434 RepID=A0A926NLL5_9BACI|nr:hypothetical protein [Metabacillus arenae]MBD1382843.1 hypothetical protein [Metabacillus arenae]
MLTNKQLISEQRDYQILLNAPANSLSAKGDLQNICCEFSFSEFQMKWSETDFEHVK